MIKYLIYKYILPVYQPALNLMYIDIIKHQYSLKSYLKFIITTRQKICDNIKSWKNWRPVILIPKLNFDNH